MAGKHRARSQFVPRVIKFGTASLVASGIPLVSVGNAEATEFSSPVLEIIAKCESGNRNINTLGNSTASGFLQILDSTWRAFGGSEFAQRAIHASREEQFIVGSRILAGQGISAWNPSRSCWESKVGSTPPPQKIIPTTPPVKAIKPNPKKVIVKKATQSPNALARKVARSYVIKRGDTLSKIAKRNGTTWRALFAANRDTVKNPNLIYAGASLRLR